MSSWRLKVKFHFDSVSVQTLSDSCWLEYFYFIIWFDCWIEMKFLFTKNLFLLKLNRCVKDVLQWLFRVGWADFSKNKVFTNNCLSILGRPYKVDYLPRLPMRPCEVAKQGKCCPLGNQMLLPLELKLCWASPHTFLSMGWGGRGSLHTADAHFCTHLSRALSHYNFWQFFSSLFYTLIGVPGTF